MRTRPFRDGHTFASFRLLIEKTTQEIDSLDNEYVLKVSLTELEQFYISKVTIEPISLNVEGQYIEDQKSTQIDVSHDFSRGVFPGERAIVKGTSVLIAVPYAGDPGLWRIQPSTHNLSAYPELDIRDNLIVFTCTFPDDSANTERLKSEIQGHIQSLANAVENLRRDIDNHNQSTPPLIRSALNQKWTKAQAAVGAVAALGIPIKQRDQPLTFTVPTKRRESPVKCPAASTGKYAPEPILDQKEYEHILTILKSISIVIERNPNAFASLDEESIRTHFLLQLNGHYEGGATGETFNAAGKTDILVRSDNRNIFIAECKFWRGSKSFERAIDQLLGYLSWRDSKCALLIFNQLKDSTAVRQKMHDAMTSRPEHVKTLNADTSGDSHYIFIKPSDPGREIKICTMLFDIPIAVATNA